MANQKTGANTMRAVIILTSLFFVGCATTETAAQYCDKYYSERNTDWLQCEQNERLIRAANYSNSLRVQQIHHKPFQQVQPIYRP
jgi:hypothetical protein